MDKQDKATLNAKVNLVLQELKSDPYRKFNIAFSLMSVIPFLVFFYLLATKTFTLNILAGEVGIILFISIFISLCGFSISYNVIKDILTKLIFYAAQAKHSDQLKSTFVATVSHELKNPLAVLKLNLLNMLDGLLGEINEEQKKLLKTSHGVIERMHSLINDLLDLHKIEAGMVEVKRKLCNLVEILEKQATEFEIMLSKKHIKLLKGIADKELSIWADEDKIMRVVNNLLSNAIKYTPEGGEVSLKIYPADGFIRLECTDTGPGIPADKLDKVFNKFERLDLSKEGTGLGLSITKDIIEMHKGKIWAESQSGAGTKFVVVLPQDLRRTPR